MRAVAEKPHDAVVKFDTYRNVRRIARSCLELHGSCVDVHQDQIYTT